MRAKTILRLALPAFFFLSFAASAGGNELPEMPNLKTEAFEQQKALQPRASENKFYSKEAKITLGIEALTWGLDMGFTCHNLAHGGREVGLPAKTCAQVVGPTAGFHVAGEGLAYLLHRAKIHKLERFPRWYLIESRSYCAVSQISRQLGTTCPISRPMAPAAGQKTRLTFSLPLVPALEARPA